MGRKTGGSSGVRARANVFDVLNYVVLIGLSLSILYPFWDLLMRSLSSPADSMRLGFAIIPTEWSIAAYRAVFTSGRIFINFYNSVFRTVVGTAFSLIVTFMAAYGLSKRELPGRNALTGIMVFTMFFGGGLIPSYLLVKNLGLVDTIWSLILPLVANVYNMVIIRNNIQSLDQGMEESAMLDGANQFQILFRIIIPVSKPIIATVALWCMVGHWNSWYDALLYTNKPSLAVLQLALHNLLVMQSSPEMEQIMRVSGQMQNIFTPESIKAAQIFITILPIILVYPFIQRYFVKGIMVGSLKG